MLLRTALTMEGRFCSGFAKVCEIKKDSSSHYPQGGCHPKNEDIEAHSSAKEYAKVQKRTILYIFVHLILSTFLSRLASDPTTASPRASQQGRGSSVSYSRILCTRGHEAPLVQLPASHAIRLNDDGCLLKRSIEIVYRGLNSGRFLPRVHRMRVSRTHRG